MGRLLLWDVDGTLLRAPGIGIAALHRAIERVVGAAPTATVQYAGMLDPNITVAYLETLGVDPSRHLDAILAASVEELAAAEAEIIEHGIVLPGVNDVLARLAKQEGVLQTLVTGNLRANAVLKVAALGLEHWFDLDVGAYGEDAGEREELVPVSLERVARLRSASFDRGDVWVVGDTRHDLACARAAGVRCLLVGTGWELPDRAAEEADVYLDDLSDTEAVLSALLG